MLKINGTFYLLEVFSYQVYYYKVDMCIESSQEAARCDDSRKVEKN